MGRAKGGLPGEFTEKVLEWRCEGAEDSFGQLGSVTEHHEKKFNGIKFTRYSLNAFLTRSKDKYDIL